MQKPNKKYYPINQYIRFEELRVVGDDGTAYGVMSKDAAVRLAEEMGLDLVVVTEKATPPVAKIIDFQKFKYQQSKKEKSGAVKQKAVDTKEIRFTPFMAANDFDIRIERAKEFLSDGHRLKLVVKFSGRQMSRKDFGSQILGRAIIALSEVAKIEQEPKWQGKIYFAQLKPITIKK